MLNCKSWKYSPRSTIFIALGVEGSERKDIPSSRVLLDSLFLLAMKT
jgi:hypothetical protein